MKLVYPTGATPLEQSELEQLIPNIFTQGELNEQEKANIQRGLVWAKKSRKLRNELLSISGLFRLHFEMFGQVWKWAGQMRNTEKNIGVAPHNIQINLHNLCEDVKIWLEKEIYQIDEIGIRFHHRLVSIHPFVNGNGRHARIAADLLLQFNKIQPFSWGSRELNSAGKARTEYLAVLRKADKGDYAPLIVFSRR